MEHKKLPKFSHANMLFPTSVTPVMFSAIMIPQRTMVDKIRINPSSFILYVYLSLISFSFKELKL